MAKTTAAMRRKRRALALQSGMAFVVSVGVDGAVELTLYAGRRSLVRLLSAQDAAVLAHMLTQTSQQLPDHRSTGSYFTSKEVAHEPAPWVDPRNEKTVTAERFRASALDVVDETRRTTLLLQARNLELKAQLELNPALAEAYARAAWRPGSALQSDLIQAGMLVARVFGESVGPYEPVGFLDGEPAPQTQHEAFVLLRRLVERSGLSAMGVLKAFVAGNLAATSLVDAFPDMAAAREDGKRVRPC